MNKKIIFYAISLIIITLVIYIIIEQKKWNENCLSSSEPEVISNCMNMIGASKDRLKYINLKIDDINVSKENIYKISILLADISHYLFKYKEELYLNNNIKSKNLKDKLLNKIEKCSELGDSLCILTFVNYSELSIENKISKIKNWADSFNKDDLNKLKEFFKISGSLKKSNPEIYNVIMNL